MILLKLKIRFSFGKVENSIMKKQIKKLFQSKNSSILSWNNIGDVKIQRTSSIFKFKRSTLDKNRMNFMTIFEKLN